MHCRFVGSKEEDEGEGEEKERGARAQSSGPPSISANMPASYSIDLNVHFSHARCVSLTRHLININSDNCKIVKSTTGC